jgi:hypothetical protein
MSIIISKDDFKIIQENPYKFTIQFNVSSEALIKSITKSRIILGATSTNNYRSLTFSAATIKTFVEYQQHHHTIYGNKQLTIQNASKMLAHLAVQLDALISSSSKTFIGYNPENIIVIDDNKFIYLSNEYLHDIEEETENITLTYPFTEKDFFLSPELKKINILPSKVHYKTSYYSLAVLILYAHTGESEIETEKADKNFATHSLKVDNNFGALLSKVCKEPKRRSILLI